MGKAYTETEKQEIREKIWIEGLKFFHDESSEELNIRELTKRVGISLGSFYNFYPDKDKLVNDICVYRVNQKLDRFRSTFSESLENPYSYMYHVILDNFEDMTSKIRSKKIYADAFGMLINEAQYTNSTYTNIFIQFLNELLSYWHENGRKIMMDVDGVWSLILGLIGIFEVKSTINEKYFNEIADMYLKEGLRRYIAEESDNQLESEA